MARFFQRRDTTPTSMFIPLPLELMQKNIQQKQEKRDVIESQLQKETDFGINAIKNTVVSPETAKDFQLKQKLDEESKKRNDELISLMLSKEDNTGIVERKLMDYKDWKDSQMDPGGLAYNINENYKLRAKAFEDIDKNDKYTKDWKDYYKKQWDQTYLKKGYVGADDINNYDAEKINKYGTTSQAKFYELNKYTEGLAKDITPDIEKDWGTTQEEGQFLAHITGGKEQRTAGRIAHGILKGVTSNVDAMEYVNQEIEVRSMEQYWNVINSGGSEEDAMKAYKQRKGIEQMALDEKNYVVDGQMQTDRFKGTVAGDQVSNTAYNFKYLKEKSDKTLHQDFTRDYASGGGKYKPVLGTYSVATAGASSDNIKYDDLTKSLTDLGTNIAATQEKLKGATGYQKDVLNKQLQGYTKDLMYKKIQLKEAIAKTGIDVENVFNPTVMSSKVVTDYLKENPTATKYELAMDMANNGPFKQYMAKKSAVSKVPFSSDYKYGGGSSTGTEEEQKNAKMMMLLQDRTSGIKDLEIPISAPVKILKGGDNTLGKDQQQFLYNNILTTGVTDAEGNHIKVVKDGFSVDMAIDSRDGKPMQVVNIYKGEDGKTLDTPLQIVTPMSEEVRGRMKSVAKNVARSAYYSPDLSNEDRTDQFNYAKAITADDIVGKDLDAILPMTKTSKDAPFKLPINISVNGSSKQFIQEFKPLGDDAFVPMMNGEPIMENGKQKVIPSTTDLKLFIYDLYLKGTDDDITSEFETKQE